VRHSSPSATSTSITPPSAISLPITKRPIGVSGA
jgi:hypothetical protein